MKCRYRSVLSLILILSLCMCAALLPMQVSAQAYVNNTPVQSGDFHYEDYASSSDKKVLREFAEVLPYFTLSDGHLALSRSISTLEQELSLSKETVAKIQEVLSLDYSQKSFDKTEGTVTPNVHVSDWKIYFTADDVVNLLMSAAQLGPAAITAALSAAMSVFPGFGTVAGAVIGYLGGAYICYTVMQAVANHQGLYFGITWNGAFPNPVFGYW